MKPVPECPPDGLSTQVRINRIIDGDTVEVTLERKFNIRMLNYSSPEMNTAEGKLAKEQLAEKVKVGDEVHIFIPAFKADRLIDNTTFNRVLAYIYTKDKEPL